MNSNKTISILGTGWLGSALAQSLAQSGHTVKGSTTTPSKLELIKSWGVEPYLIDLSTDSGDKAFYDADTLIINITPGRRDPVRHAQYPQRIESALKAASTGQIKNGMLISSTGVYKSMEASAPDWTFPIYIDEVPNATDSVLKDAEDLLPQYFRETGTIIRFGGLVGGERLAGRFLAGKKDIANGHAPVNMIHQDDCIGIIRKVMERGAWGNRFNATTDGHPTRMEFYKAQAEKYGFVGPEFLESDLAEGKVISNQRLKAKLEYTFIHPDPMLF